MKTYLYYWTRHLKREASGTEIRLFPMLGNVSGLDHEGSVANPVMTRMGLHTVFALNRLPAAFSAPLWPRTDVFHAARLLHLPEHPKRTATIYDLTCWLIPEAHQRANVVAEKRIAEQIWKRADGLIAISECTRSDAVRLLGIPERKIRVIYPGVPEAYSLAGRAEAEVVRARLRLHRPYLLFVGTIEPRKNVDLLLDAFEALSPSVAEDFELILAGPRGWAAAGTLARLENSPKNVRYLGYVPEDDLPGLFRGATGFVYPSLYEGFGLPVAQAMAAGVPVITSGVSALGEITGEAALLVDPRSVGELRGAMVKLLTSAGLRERLGERARVRGRTFTWERCAQESLTFFERVVGDGLNWQGSRCGV